MRKTPSCGTLTVHSPIVYAYMRDKTFWIQEVFSSAVVYIICVSLFMVDNNKSRLHLYLQYKIHFSR